MDATNTPTPETDAAAEFIHDRGMTEWVPVEVSLSLERRLAAAEAELEAMRSGEGVAWRCSGCGRITDDPDRDSKDLASMGYLSCCPERKMLPFRPAPTPDSGEPHA